MYLYIFIHIHIYTYTHLLYVVHSHVYRVSESSCSAIDSKVRIFHVFIYIHTYTHIHIYTLVFYCTLSCIQGVRTMMLSKSKDSLAASANTTYSGRLQNILRTSRIVHIQEFQNSKYGNSEIILTGYYLFSIFQIYMTDQR